MGEHFNRSNTRHFSMYNVIYDQLNSATVHLHPKYTAPGHCSLTSGMAGTSAG